jgi:hypothetical protein
MPPTTMPIQSLSATWAVVLPGRHLRLLWRCVAWHLAPHADPVVQEPFIDLGRRLDAARPIHGTAVISAGAAMPNDPTHSHGTPLLLRFDEDELRWLGYVRWSVRRGFGQYREDVTSDMLAAAAHPRPGQPRPPVVVVCDRCRRVHAA